MIGSWMKLWRHCRARRRRLEPEHEKSSGEVVVKGKKGKRTKRFGLAGSKMAVSLEDEIHDLEDTIQKNKELCKRLNDRAERIEVASSKAATSKAEARQRAAELSAKATALEEEEEMLEYKKFMRERLRGRFESMQVLLPTTHGRTEREEANRETSQCCRRRFVRWKKRWRISITLRSSHCNEIRSFQGGAPLQSVN